MKFDKMKKNFFGVGSEQIAAPSACILAYLEIISKYFSTF